MRSRSFIGGIMRGVRSVSPSLAEAEANDTVARKLYALRKRAGLTQQRLAKLVGTTTSVICRLEDADYQGHSLAMLRRVAIELNKRRELRFVEARSRQERRGRGGGGD